MSAPEDNPADDLEPTEEEWDEYEPNREMLPHPSIACPDCDDVSNELCPLCRGSDQHCPICFCAADECEFQEGSGDE